MEGMTFPALLFLGVFFFFFFYMCLCPISSLFPFFFSTLLLAQMTILNILCLFPPPHTHKKKKEVLDCISCYFSFLLSIRGGCDLCCTKHRPSSRCGAFAMIKVFLFHWHDPLPRSHCDKEGVNVCIVA